MGIKLDVTATSETPSPKYSGLMWIQLSEMQNAQVALETKGRKIAQVICHDAAVCEALHILKQAKLLIRQHGATEELLSVFNEDNQLSRAIGVTIPAVTSVNQLAVGNLCCEGIDQTVEAAYSKVKAFFHELAKQVAEYLDQLKETSACQQATLNELMDTVLGQVDHIDAEAFSTDEVFGYTQPVFMQHVEALNSINQALPTITPETLNSIEAPLQVLGFKLDTEITITEATPEEQAASAPAPQEVMSPPVAAAPNAEAETAEAKAETKEAKEDLEPAEKDVPTKETEDPKSAESDSKPATDVPTAESEAAPQRESEDKVPNDEPANAPQTQEMATFRWTPASLKEAISELRSVISNVASLDKVRELILERKVKTCALIDQLGNEGADKAAIDQEIEASRKFAATVGKVAQLYGTECSHLVDQVATMCGKLKKAEVAPEAPEATPVDEVTEAKPLGDNRKIKKVRKQMRSFFDELENENVIEHPFDPEEQLDDPAGELPDETEGPVEDTEVPTATEPKDYLDFLLDENRSEMDPEANSEAQEEDFEEPTADDIQPVDSLWWLDEAEEPVMAPEEPEVQPTTLNPDSGLVVEEPIVPPAAQPVAAPAEEEPAVVEPVVAPQEEPIVVEPVVAPQDEPIAPVTPVTPVEPDGSPIKEVPLVPPQPVMTNEAGIEVPEGMPDGEIAPKPLDEPAPDVDPNGDPMIPAVITEPLREPVETPAEDIPDTSAEKELNDTWFRFF